MSRLGQHPPFQQLNSPIRLCKGPCLPEPRGVFSEDGGCAWTGPSGEGGLCTHRIPSGCGKLFKRLSSFSNSTNTKPWTTFSPPKAVHRRLHPDTKAGEQTGTSPICPVIPVSEAPPRQSGERSPHGTTLAPRAWSFQGSKGENMERRARVQRERAQWQESEQHQTTTWALRANEDACAPPSRGSWRTRYFISWAQQTGDEAEGNSSFSVSQAQC